MTYVKTAYLSNVTSGCSPVTTSGPPFAGKVDLEAFCLPQGGFEYIIVEYIESSNKQKQRLVKSQMELGEVKLEMLSSALLPYCAILPWFSFYYLLATFQWCCLIKKKQERQQQQFKKQTDKKKKRKRSCMCISPVKL